MSDVNWVRLRIVLLLVSAWLWCAAPPLAAQPSPIPNAVKLAEDFLAFTDKGGMFDYSDIARLDTLFAESVDANGRTFFKNTLLSLSSSLGKAERRQIIDSRPFSTMPLTKQQGEFALVVFEAVRRT